MSRGRRPGSPDTRAVIVAAARKRFAAAGYGAASLRSIAAEAGVDPALVHHYFGSKGDLFLAAMQLPVDPREVMAPVVALGPDGAGERLLRTFLGVWDRPELRVPLTGFARGLVDDEARDLVRDGFLRVVIAPIGEAMGLDHPERRMPLVATQLFGLVLVRYLLELDPLASMATEDVVGLYAPIVQRFLTDPLPGVVT